MPEHGGVRIKNGPALAGHGAEAVRDAIAATITTLPEQLRRSLTWDQGVELAQHVQLRIDTGLQIYFCDPHSPGSAVRMRTPTVSYASTSPRAPTSADTPPLSSPPSLRRSTAARVEHSHGGLQQRRSRLSYTRPSSSTMVLRPPVESALAAAVRVMDQPARRAARPERHLQRSGGQFGAQRCPGRQPALRGRQLTVIFRSEAVQVSRPVRSSCRCGSELPGRADACYGCCGGVCRLRPPFDGCTGKATS